MLVILLVKVVQQKQRPYMAIKVFKAVQHFESKYGEKAAAWAIAAMVVYLVIAQ
jgi:hypothetical protein